MDLRAVPFGDDGVTGDSSFIPDEKDDSFPATETSTFEELLAAWTAKQEDDEGEKPVGFWLVTPEHLSIACIPMDNDYGNDGQWYSLVRSSKSICARLAVRTV